MKGYFPTFRLRLDSAVTPKIPERRSPRIVRTVMIFGQSPDRKLDISSRARKHSFTHFPEFLPGGGWVARHNREGHGADQRGFEYGVNYQPDWLRQVKVTRQLETGRQSTKTLFRRPSDRAEAEPGERVRTRIVSQDQGLDFEVALTDPKGSVRRIRVAYALPDEHGGREEEVEFTLECDLSRSRS
jgi:hypothetical protein